MRSSIRTTDLLAPAALASAMLAERALPLRGRTEAERRRAPVNLALGALSMAVVAVVEGPIVRRLARRSADRRTGLVARLPLPRPVRDALAFVALDYTMFIWHVLTHKVPFLWRFHLVHHVDLDLDATTALRFHAVDMLISVPWRAAQVTLIGASPRAFRAWQAFFFGSVVFHHSNLRLPERAERRLATVLTTPRMHGIHHSAVRGETDSNWSSGISWWDHLHRTFRLDVPQTRIRIGVPAYRDPGETRLVRSLAMPFARQRDAWSCLANGPDRR